MDREQAKIILSAHRPGRDDEPDDASLAQALALMENDPALAEWFAEQTALDAAMRDAVQAIEVPAHLKESILASAKTVSFPPVRRFSVRPIWLAAAALLVLGLVVATLFQRDDRPSFAALEAEVPQLTAKHQHPFGGRMADLDKIRAWFASNGAPSQFTMPASLQKAPGMGCEVVSIGGAKVSLLCFEAGPHHAHLYVVDKSQLAHTPAVGAPMEMHQQGAYAMASWSEGSLTYILATRGTENSVRELL